ncbi:MAG: CPBP family intramembrane metalloprotease [Clostridia bacterium]|nr:CPBP family intramembrane metalloprotease [Clostridia bacterium]
MKPQEEKSKNLLASLLGEKTLEKTSGISFSAAVILPVLLVLVFFFVGSLFGLFADGYAEKDWYKYFNFLLPQLAYALVAVFFLKYLSVGVKEFTGKPSVKYFFLAALLQFGLFSLSELNGLFLRFLEGFGYGGLKIELPSLDGFGLVGVLFVVAVLPAVFEEVLFRGIILKGLRGFSAGAAVLLCGGLFSLFHQNPAQTAYQFCCGVCFALLALRAESVLPTVLAHFLNNAVVILLAKFPLPALSGVWLIVAYVLSAFALLGSLVYLIFFDKKERIKAEKKGKAEFFLCAAAGILICLISWAINLVGGV